MTRHPWLSTPCMTAFWQYLNHKNRYATMSPSTPGIMMTLCRLPTLCGIIILGLSLIYLSIFGPPLLHSRLDSATLWNDITQTLHIPTNHSQAKNHTVTYHHSSKQAPTTTSNYLLSTYTHDNAATAIASKPAGHHSSLSMDAADSACSAAKPNLILSAIDGPKLQDQIFIFMQSLDISLGEEFLASQRARSCPPAPIQVHILVPPTFLEEIPSGFKALMQRYSVPGVCPRPPGHRRRECRSPPLWRLVRVPQADSRPVRQSPSQRPGRSLPEESVCHANGLRR